MGSLVEELIIGGGTPTATPHQAREYLRTAPDRLLTDAEIEEIVAAFVHWGGLVGIAWDRPFAQACHETRLFRFGNQVALVQRNPAGIGATNDGAPGLTFPTWTQGIAAMLIHLMAWCDRLDLAKLIHRTPTDLDPRIPIVAQVRAEKGKAVTWGDLGGRWAVPGVGYAAAIERHHNAILALPDAPGATKGPNMALAIRDAIIPATNANRPKLPMVPKYITVHETSNPNVGADAEMHRKFLVNGGGPEGVSFHWCVDDTEAVHLIPDNENAWHAGDGANGTGNRQSIGIETCVNADGDWAKTRANLAALVAHLMVRHGIPLANVVQHNRWSQKNCPLIMRRDGLWAGQIAAIKVAYEALTKPPAPSGMMEPVITERRDWQGKGKLVAEEVTVVNTDTGKHYSRKVRHDAAGVVLEDWREV